MSLDIMRLVWDYEFPNPSLKLVALSMADHASVNGYCWPSIKQIMRRSQLNKRQIQYHIEHLENLGLIKRVPRFADNGRQLANGYQWSSQFTEGEDAMGCTQGCNGVHGEGAVHCTGEDAVGCTPLKRTTIDEPPLEPSNGSKRRKVNLTDAAFIESLKSNDAYNGIDIDRELGKAKAWQLAHPGRQLTRGFFVNWLNKTDRPMHVNGNNGRKSVAETDMQRTGLKNERLELREY